MEPVMESLKERRKRIKLFADDVIPDRVSLERNSPYFWHAYRKIGVKIDGVIRRADVVEFCVSEGWAMVQVKKMGLRVPDPATNGRTFLLERVQGVIEPYWITKDQVAAKPVDASALAAAELKRQRKAEKLRQIAERNTHG
jgi:hypothetical protein